MNELARPLQKGYENLLDNENSPEMLAFLSYLDQQIEEHPELIVEADYAQLDRIAKLVEWVLPE